MPPETTTTEPDGVADAVAAQPGSVVLVTGAPGTGKTTAARAVVTRAVRDGVALDGCLVLAAGRVQAGRLRARMDRDIGGTHTEPLVRTASSLAFSVLRHAAATEGLGAPRLLTGAEQDAVLRELLEGHASGDAPAPGWPEDVRGALGTSGFRTQLRDLLMRAVEHGVGADALADLGRRLGRPEWVAAARVMEEYDQVTALSTPGAYDPAWICAAAADRLEGDEMLRRRFTERLRLVVVDDAQEVSASAARLLAALHGAGLTVVLIGDGDAVVQGFRGAAPERFVGLADELAARTPRRLPVRLVLSTAYRQAPALAEVTARVADRIGVSAGAGHRRPAVTGRPGDGQVEVVTLHTAAQEAAYVAQRLRRAHLLEGVAWSDMAVVARSRSAHGAVSRALQSGGVPVQPGRSTEPLGQDPATRPLLLAYGAVLRARDGASPALTAEHAVELVGSPLGRADPVTLRRLRRALRRDHAERGGPVDGGVPPPHAPREPVDLRPALQPTADELLARAVCDPVWSLDPAVRETEDLAPAVRLADLVREGVAVLSGDSGAAKDAHTLLWSLWQASGLAPVWERQALEGGPAGARADRQLDAVLVLFGAAEDYVTRLRRSDARGFLEHVAAQELAPDSLVPHGVRVDAVEVVTPFAAAGREWDVVAVTGVQEGVWPDLRLRDSLLGAQALVEVLRGRPVDGAAGIRAAHASVLADETRQFHVAVSRARRRLLVTAVASTDEQPSSFLSLVDPDTDLSAARQVPVAPTLRGLVAALRRDLARAHAGGDAALRDARADLLEVLADAGVPGSDPARWWDAREPSTDLPRVPDGPVPVSPSKVQAFSECSLRWLLTSHGGDSRTVVSSAVGTLVHAVVAGSPHAERSALCEQLRARWPELRMDDSWVSRRELARAEAMLDAYVTYRQHAEGQGRELVGVEVPGRVQVGRALVVGQVDRLEQDADGRFLVVDLKTGSGKPAKADVPRHPQLGAYQVALRAGAFAEVTGPSPVSAGAALAHLGRAAVRTGAPQVQPPLEEDEDPGWAEALLRSAADGMAGASFTATVGDWCRTCPVTFSCPLQPDGDSR
jgi:superfamily I DNA/RNA helicase/RecB family exonuclease